MDKHPTSNEKGPGLGRNYSWTLLGNSVFAASQWAMIPVLVKMSDAATVGQFGLALAITSPVLTFSRLQLRGIQASDVKGVNQFSDYLGLRIISSAIGLSIILLILILSEYHIMMACVILAVGAAKIFDSLSDICYGFFQVNERMDMVAASLIIKSLVGLISFAALYVFTDSLAAASTGWALIWGAIFLLHDIGRVKRLRLALIGSDSLKTTNTEKVGIWPTWNQRILVKLGLLALPLGLSLGFDSLALNIPRYFLSYYRSEADLGIFMSLQYIVMSFSIIAMPLGQAALPRLAKYYSAGDYSSYIRMISVFLIVGLISGLIITFLSVNFGSEILIFVYSKAYANNHIAFIWLTVGGATNIIFLFLAFGLLASRDFRLMALPYFAGPVAATALSAITIQDMGILGASITYAGVNLFVCLFMAICLVYKTCEGLK